VDHFFSSFSLSTSPRLHPPLADGWRYVRAARGGRYVRFVELCVVTSIYALGRSELKEKVMLGPEIQEMLHQSPVVKEFVQAIIQCDYAAFFRSLGKGARCLC
jgi:hypothetical protein